MEQFIKLSIGPYYYMIIRDKADANQSLKIERHESVSCIYFAQRCDTVREALKYIRTNFETRMRFKYRS